MTMNYADPSRRRAFLALVSVLGLVTGCLYTRDPGHIDGDPVRMDGVRVELIRHSAACGSAESQGLIVEVGPGVEYPVEAVQALKASCPDEPNPAVEVYIEDSAVVLDFSEVAGPGSFPDGEFEGYILDMVRTANAPVLLLATVDWGMTTLDVFEDDIRFNRDRVEINLAGVRFDSTSVLKIDLYLASVSDPGADESSGQM